MRASHGPVPSWPKTKSMQFGRFGGSDRRCRARVFDTDLTGGWNRRSEAYDSARVVFRLLVVPGAAWAVGRNMDCRVFVS